jgi:hypothetical protein
MGKISWLAYDFMVKSHGSARGTLRPGSRRLSGISWKLKGLEK